MTCAWFELFSRIPFPGSRLRLCAWHAASCPRCRRASEAVEHLPRLISADRLPRGLDLWPGVRRGIDDPRRTAGDPVAITVSARNARHWAFAAAMLLLAFFAGYMAFFLGRGMQPHPGPRERRPNMQIRLCSAKVADRPARVFRIQSRDPDRAIFWIAKSENRS